MIFARRESGRESVPGGTLFGLGISLAPKWFTAKVSCAFSTGSGGFLFFNQSLPS
jgi:hypothetical protein